RVCAALIDLGIRPGDRVAILSETRLEWAVADFAVLTAGAVTVPIYPTLPAVQIEPLLADSEVAALFCSTTAHFEKVLASWPRLPSLRLVVLFEGQVTTRPLPGRVLPLPEFEAMGVKRLEREPRLVEERADSVTPDHLASIIYTSGTTGTPKGVMLTHANFVATVAAPPAPLHTPAARPDPLAPAALPRVRADGGPVLARARGRARRLRRFDRDLARQHPRSASHDRHVGAAPVREDPRARP